MSVIYKDEFVKIFTTLLSSVCFIFFTSVVFANGDNTITESSTKKLQALEKWIDEQGRNGQLSGTFLFARKGQVILKKAVGNIHPDRTEAITLDSSFNLGSVSKQFTGMAIMLLNNHGKLQYDTKVQHYLKEFPYPNITVRHLLNHTSGLVDYMALAEEHWDESLFTNQDMLNLFSKHKPALNFSSGSKFEYSNTGYVTLSAIIERVSKMSFAQYLDENIFQPLKMNNTKVINLLSEPNLLPSRVYGQNQSGLDDLIYLDGVSGDGAVYSSIDDLLKWHYGLLNYELLPKHQQQVAFLPATLNDDSLFHYGFGWFIDRESPHIVAHSGGWVGFISYIARNTENDEVIIFLTNKVGGVKFEDLQKQIFSALDADFGEFQ